MSVSLSKLYWSVRLDLGFGNAIGFFILLLNRIEVQVVLQLQPFPIAVIAPPGTYQTRCLRNMPI